MDNDDTDDNNEINKLQSYSFEDSLFYDSKVA